MDFLDIFASTPLEPFGIVGAGVIMLALLILWVSENEIRSVIWLAVIILVIWIFLRNNGFLGV